LSEKKNAKEHLFSLIKKRFGEGGAIPRSQQVGREGGKKEGKTYFNL